MLDAARFLALDSSEAVRKDSSLVFDLIVLQVR